MVICHSSCRKLIESVFYKFKDSFSFRETQVQEYILHLRILCLLYTFEFLWNVGGAIVPTQQGYLGLDKTLDVKCLQFHRFLLVRSQVITTLAAYSAPLGPWAVAGVRTQAIARPASLPPCLPEWRSGGGWGAVSWEARVGKNWPPRCRDAGGAQAFSGC